LIFFSSLLQLVLPVLGQIKIPDSTEEREKMFEFTAKPGVAQMLLDFLLDVLLMPYRFAGEFTCLKQYTTSLYTLASDTLWQILITNPFPRVRFF